MNNRSFLSQLAVLALVTIVTSAAADQHRSDVEREFTKYNERYNDIIREYDLEAFVGLYNDAPLWIAPNEAPVSGLDVPSNTFGFILENQGMLTHTFEHLFVSDDGSQAVMIGRYDLNVDKVGALATGTYLFVLERQDERWRIVVDMFNEHIAE